MGVSAGGAILRWIVTCAVIWVAPAAHAQLLPLGASQKFEVGCDWVLAYDAEVAGLGNFAFPETAAAPCTVWTGFGRWTPIWAGHESVRHFARCWRS